MTMAQLSLSKHTGVLRLTAPRMTPFPIRLVGLRKVTTSRDGCGRYLENPHFPHSNRQSYRLRADSPDLH
ncbi:hypothetical protein LAUMK136_01738 [Mycobacterium attenuatum]|uniref:Uncharacterized protein n=1 Tax=Mycobacterium attenuatum TaxID=2341086 RepID=A0A498PVU5_9MYCO|nr:hypothetical protein LAUMK136_01738 [Mycobacterium attenuatum]